MIKKTFQINHVEETENVKWCVFKVTQYIIITQSVKHYVHVYNVNSAAQGP